MENAQGAAAGQLAHLGRAMGRLRCDRVFRDTAAVASQRGRRGPWRRAIVCWCVVADEDDVDPDASDPLLLLLLGHIHDPSL
jgi:hypothetical protein